MSGKSNVDPVGPTMLNNPLDIGNTSFKKKEKKKKDNYCIVIDNDIIEAPLKCGSCGK